MQVFALKVFSHKHTQHLSCWRVYVCVCVLVVCLSASLHRLATSFLALSLALCWITITKVFIYRLLLVFGSFVATFATVTTCRHLNFAFHTRLLRFGQLVFSLKLSWWRYGKLRAYHLLILGSSVISFYFLELSGSFEILIDSLKSLNKLDKQIFSRQKLKEFLKFLVHEIV